MTDRLYSLIGKYALTLSILYFVSYGFNLAVNYSEFDVDLKSIAVIRLAPKLLDWLLNAVAAFMVYADINKYNVKTKYVVFATILYRPLGVVAFLLFLILQNTGGTQQWNSLESDPDIIDQ